MKRALLLGLLTALFLGPLAGCASTGAPAEASGPRVLGVIAHPDDETTFAASAWAIARRLGGTVDLVVITNGEGGFKYSTLGEELYGLELTREEVGRAELPRIRRSEMEAAAEILGVRELVFLSERDHRYTRDEGEILGPGAGVWNLARIAAELDLRLERGAYDAAFCLLPTEGTHGHHKAASILLLQAVERLPADERPVVLGGSVERAGDARADYGGLAGWPATAPADDGPYVFDRERRFGFRSALDWGVVVDWVIAEHKSQGTLSMMAGTGAREVFWRFALGPPDGAEVAEGLFGDLGDSTYPAREYGASAGTNADG